MERRRSPRLGMSFQVACNMLSKNHYFYTVSKNLCLGGLRIICNEFISVNSPLKISVNLIDRVITLKARVAWCNRRRISDRYSVGLEFLEVNQANKRHIDNFLQNMPLA